MTLLSRKEYIIPLIMLLVFLLITFEPKGYDFIAFALCSLLLAYAGFLRRKDMIDKVAIVSGLALFLVFCILFFVQ